MARYSSHTPFFVRSWEPFIEQEIENIHAIPVWMTIKKVSVHVFNPVGLSYIASVVGKPLLLDGPTAARTRMSFARVCVEINPKSVLKKKITDVFDNGFKCTVDVDYAWKPAQCPSCSTFCHSEARCPKKVNEQVAAPPTLIYVPKDKPSPHPAPQESAVQIQSDQNLSQAEKDWLPMNNKRKSMKAESNDKTFGSGSDHVVFPLYPPGFEPDRVQQNTSPSINVTISQNSFSVLEDSGGSEVLENMEILSNPSMQEAPNLASSMVTTPSTIDKGLLIS